jgi:Trk K+ transport system NAD-binding subunit
MVCQLGHILGPVATTIARIENNAYSQGAFGAAIKEHFHVNMFFSSHDFSAQAIMNALNHPAAFDASTLSNGSLTLLGIYIGLEHPWRGKTIEEIENLHPFSLSILRVMRHQNAWIPTAHETLAASDCIYLIVDSNYIKDIYILWNWPQRLPKSILFLGSSPTIFTVLPSMVNAGFSLSLVSDNEADLLRLSQEFPSVQLTQGSCMAPSPMNRLMNQGEMCALASGPKDTDTILAAAMAGVVGATHTMACIHNLEYMLPGCVLGIGKMVHSGPKILTAILQKITQKTIEAVYPLHGVSTGSVIEAVVGPGAKITKRSCADWQEDRWRIVALWRNNTWHWHPETIQAHDRVIITALWDGYHLVQKFLTIG